jgi:hypothetical protein
MTNFQAKAQEAFRDAQTKARAFEKDARKLAETLGDRAQAELKGLLKVAQSGSREQIHALGVELEKLGKRLQEVAKEKAVAEAVQ